MRKRKPPTTYVAVSGRYRRQWLHRQDSFAGRLTKKKRRSKKRLTNKRKRGQ
jgi:hypothetical protein